MIFRYYHSFRRFKYVSLVVPAAGLCWQSKKQNKPSRVLSPQHPPIIIFSPSEHSLSLIDHVWEYILTAKRFIYLFLLFIPVLVSSPVLLIGKPKNSLRWGAVWWYGLLVSRMETAGPTFIKVNNNLIIMLHISIQFLISWLNGPLQGPTSFHLCCVNASVLSTPVENPILLSTQKPSSNPFFNNHLIMYFNRLIPIPLGQVPLPR